MGHAPWGPPCGPSWPWTLGELKSTLYSSSFVNRLPVSRVKFLESRKVKYFGDYLYSQGSDDLGPGIFGFLEGRRSISMLLDVGFQWPGLPCAMRRPQLRQLGCSVSEVSGLGEVGGSPLNPYNHAFSSPFLLVPYGSRNDIWWPYFRFEKVSSLCLASESKKREGGDTNAQIIKLVAPNMQQKLSGETPVR